MMNSYTPPKYTMVLTIFLIIFSFGIAGLSFIQGNEIAPIILGLAVVASVGSIYVLHINALHLDISNQEVIIYKGKKEIARYTRSQYNFEIIKRRYPGKKSPTIFLIVSNETEGKKEYDISILGLKNFRLVADDLNCQAPDLIGNRIIN